MPPVGFEPTIPASQRPQTHGLDGAATGMGGTEFHTAFVADKLFRYLEIIARPEGEKICSGCS
jgi:hypothetical protein